MDDEIKKNLNLAQPPSGIEGTLKYFNDLHEVQARFSRAISDFQENIQNTLKRALEAHNEMEQKLRRALDVDFSFMAPVLQDLSQYGWYLNLGMTITDVAAVKRILASGDENQLNQCMVLLLKEELAGDVGRLCGKHSNRSDAIEQAFKAHEAGLYYASMPVIFAQIDGLSYELTGYKFFDNDRRTYEPEIAKWVAENASTSSLESAYLSVLLDKGAFQKHRNNPNRISFTRHSILHGETTDYGTEINSLKAFSLLLFLSDMCTP